MRPPKTTLAALLASRYAIFAVRHRPVLVAASPFRTRSTVFRGGWSVGPASGEVSPQGRAGVVSAQGSVHLSSLTL